MPEKLRKLLAALETVEVHGKKNITTMLGCIGYIEELIKETEKERKVDENG